jgi:hypothetical protein
VGHHAPLTLQALLNIARLNSRTAGRCPHCLRSAARRTLARYRNVDQALLFGLNLIPDGTGELRVGDEVTVLD